MGTAVSTVGFTILTFLSGFLVARLLGAEGRGHYGTIQFWSQFVMVLCTFSLYQAGTVILRNDGQDPRPHLSAMFFVSAALYGITVMVILLGVSFGVISVEGVSVGAGLFYLLAMAAVSYLNRSFDSLETAQLRFTTINIERLIAPGSAVVILVVVALFGTVTLELVLLAFLIGKLPVLAVRFWRYRHFLLRAVDLDFARRASGLGLKFHMAQSLTIISQQIDRLVLVSTWPADRLGHYFVAMSAAGAGFAMLTQAIGMTLLPSLAGCAKEQRRDRTERVFRYCLIAASGFSVMIILTAPFLIPFIFGEAFRPAVIYTQGLAVAMALSPLSAVVLEANRAVARGRPGVEMAIASLLIFLGIYVMTGFAEAWQLFLAMGLANFAAILVGLRHPISAGDFRLSHGLIPRPQDILFLLREIRAALPTRHQG